MFKYLIAFFCYTLFSISISAQDVTEEANPYLNELPKWQNVLTQYVDEQGRTDFHGVAKNPGDLNAFVEAIGQVSPDTHKDLFTTREQVIAYHINAYNALAMHGIVERKIPKGFSSFLKRASFFRYRKVLIGGKKTNLYHYENRVIRPLDEPRTHFALNCMVRDCPRLPQQVFTEENLEGMLQSLSVEFLNKDKHVELDDDKKTVKVSAILDFYTKDFVSSGKRNDLLNYINPFRTNKIPADYKVKYMKYDWTVNIQPE